MLAFTEFSCLERHVYSAVVTVLEKRPVDPQQPGEFDAPEVGVMAYPDFALHQGKRIYE